MKNIAAVTGSRAEYGILYPVLKAIQAHQDLSLFLVVTGMHLSHEFGYTVQDIERDGFKIDAKVDMLPGHDTPGYMAESVGRGIIGMVQIWEKLKPDIILLLGDRVEPLAAAITGAYMNIPVAHIHGGDKSMGGHVDDYIRHAITKLAHIHFPVTPKSAERILKLGEEAWRVHMVGSPALDTILNEPALPHKTLAERLKIDLSQPVILVLQNPVTTQSDKAAEQMRKTLEAIAEIAKPTVLLYPNSDAGSRRMIEVIKEYQRYTFIKTFPNLPRQEFLSLMKVASVMVGNSSSGIIEAPSFGLPVVNIGSRQAERERGKNVIDVGHNKGEIIKGIEKALTDKKFLAEVKKCQSPYGNGRASQKIAEILSKIEITPQLLQKKITY